MQNTMKFTLVHPFYAGEVIIYPLLFHGDRVFRVELYGCYLGQFSFLMSYVMIYYVTMLWILVY